MNKKLIIACLFCFISAFSFAQEISDSIEFEAHIAVVSKVVKDTIMLRWAPSDALAWKYANDYGYMIERYTMVRDGKLLKTFDKKLLIAQPQKPLPVDKWEQEAKTNKYAAIVAQSIYGSEFEIDEKTDNVYRMINKAEELENRFSFALFSADQSFKAAQMSGLSFIDTDIKENEKYLYKVYSSVPYEKMAIDTGYVFLDASDYTKLSKPVELEGEFNEKTVLLTWNNLYDKGLYSGYIIERSDDGCNHFFRVNINTFVNTTPEGGKSRDFAFYLDTLPKDKWKHCYRVKGVTPFGDISEPSEIITGKSFLSLGAKPFITTCNVILNSKVSVNWEFPEEYNSKIKGFSISASSHVKGKYKIISKDLIASEQREYLYENPEMVNYIIVTVIDEHDFEYESSPVLAQLEDNTPPAFPQWGTGTIDSTGLVILSWRSNTELDLAGYRVFRSNDSKTEFMQITTDAIVDSFYTTRVNLNTLSKYVYYRIVATDFHGNSSEFSDILKLRRPDILPPAQPFFTTQALYDSCIFMGWKNSNSDDVVKTFIKRKNLENGHNEVIATFQEKDSVDNYCDDLAEPGISYEYVLFVEDESGNISHTSKNIIGKLIDRGVRQDIKNIKVSVDRKEKQIILSWEYDHNNVIAYSIYRAFDEIPLRLYKTISGNSSTFIDNNLKINTIYTYRIRATYKNGSGSPFCDPVNVEY